MCVCYFQVEEQRLLCRCV